LASDDIIRDPVRELGWEDEDVRGEETKDTHTETPWKGRKGKRARVVPLSMLFYIQYSVFGR
jgi:hypothetical protein